VARPSLPDQSGSQPPGGSLINVASALPREVVAPGNSPHPGLRGDRFADPLHAERLTAASLPPYESKDRIDPSAKLTSKGESRSRRASVRCSIYTWATRSCSGSSAPGRPSPRSRVSSTLPAPSKSDPRSAGPRGWAAKTSAPSSWSRESLGHDLVDWDQYRLSPVTDDAAQIPARCSHASSRARSPLIAASIAGSAPAPSDRRRGSRPRCRARPRDRRRRRGDRPPEHVPRRAGLCGASAVSASRSTRRASTYSRSTGVTRCDSSHPACPEMAPATEPLSVIHAISASPSGEFGGAHAKLASSTVRMTLSTFTDCTDEDGLRLGPG
jgi:hypothetical protein